MPCSVSAALLSWSHGASRVECTFHEKLCLTPRHLAEGKLARAADSFALCSLFREKRSRAALEMRALGAPVTSRLLLTCCCFPVITFVVTVTSLAAALHGDPGAAALRSFPKGLLSVRGNAASLRTDWSASHRRAAASLGACAQVRPGETAPSWDRLIVLGGRRSQNMGWAAEECACESSAGKALAAQESVGAISAGPGADGQPGVSTAGERAASSASTGHHRC